MVLEVMVQFAKPEPKTHSRPWDLLSDLSARSFPAVR